MALPEQWVLVLDEYEVANLRALLDWVSEDGVTEDGRRMNSGDWVYQILGRLPQRSQMTYGPNPGMTKDDGYR